MTKQQKTHAKDNGTIDEGKMTSIAESELEALLPEENPTERDYKLGEDGKRRNSEDIIGSPNRVGMMKCTCGAEDNEYIYTCEYTKTRLEQLSHCAGLIFGEYKVYHRHHIKN